jgi:hypothetical protein
MQEPLFPDMPTWETVNHIGKVKVEAEYDPNGDEETNLTFDTPREVFEYTVLDHFELHTQHITNQHWLRYYAGKDGGDESYFQGHLHMPMLREDLAGRLVLDLPEVVVQSVKLFTFGTGAGSARIWLPEDSHRRVFTFQEALAAKAGDILIAAENEKIGLRCELWIDQDGSGQRQEMMIKIDARRLAAAYAKYAQECVERRLTYSAKELAEAQGKHEHALRLGAALYAHKEATR